MNDYIVSNNSGCLNYDEIFLVRATSKSVAIEMIHKRHGHGFPKSSFTASSVNELLKIEGNNICVLR